jgi:hypothetical protein
MCGTFVGPCGAVAVVLVAPCGKPFRTNAALLVVACCTLRRCLSRLVVPRGTVAALLPPPSGTVDAACSAVSQLVVPLSRILW